MRLPKEDLLLAYWFLKDLKANDNVPSLNRVEEADQRITANLLAHIKADEEGE